MTGQNACEALPRYVPSGWQPPAPYTTQHLLHPDTHALPTNPPAHIRTSSRTRGVQQQQQHSAPLRSHGTGQGNPRHIAEPTAAQRPEVGLGVAAHRTATLQMQHQEQSVQCRAASEECLRNATPFSWSTTPTTCPPGAALRCSGAVAHCRSQGRSAPSGGAARSAGVQHVLVAHSLEHVGGEQQGAILKGLGAGQRARGGRRGRGGHRGRRLQAGKGRAGVTR